MVMAETPIAPNNKPVTFGAKPGREMADTRVNAEDRPVDGKPKKPKIRKAAKGAIKRGMISEKAAKRHFGGV
jgi:hypothetical protein